MSSQKITLTTTQINGLSVSGSITYTKEPALVRIILVDVNGKEHLVYESYKLLDAANNNKLSFSNICEETCILDKVTPKHLQIQIQNAKLTLTSTNYLTQSLNVANIATTKKSRQTEQTTEKIRLLNTNQKKWVAGTTPVSELSYEQKKKLFTKQDGTIPEYLPDLQGFEYYKGGIFELKSEQIGNGMTENVVQTVAENLILPSKWDWRNVHGENWNTPVKNQGEAGTCWAFADIGTMESQINLFYNQRLGVDLSEQMHVDCRIRYGVTQNPLTIQYLNDPPTQCKNINCGETGNLCKLQIGVADESCDPYVYRNPGYNCDGLHICSDWKDRLWKISDYYKYFWRDWSGCAQSISYINEKELKKVIIQKGPMKTDIHMGSGHSMVLDGYETDTADGTTIWIFKNSWGSNWGENGYAKMKFSLSHNTSGIYQAALPLGPITPPSNMQYWPSGFDGKIKCVDKDRDTYCNWGISEQKPSTCPSFCKPQKDCNDANAKLGPFISDTNFNCKMISLVAKETS